MANLTNHNVDSILRMVAKRRVYSANKFYFSLADNVYNAYGSDNINDIFRYVCESTLNKYLQPINIYYVNDNNIYPFTEDTSIKRETLEFDISNTRMLKRFKRKFPEERIRFRLESEKYSMTADLGFESIDSKECSGTVMFTDSNRKICAIGTVSVDISRYDEYNRVTSNLLIPCSLMSRFLFITSKKERISNQVVIQNSNYSLIEESFVYALNTGLHKMIDDGFKPGKLGGDIPNHNKYEMITFNRIIDELFKINLLICPMSEYINSSTSANGEIHISGETLPDYFKNMDNEKKYPLIQLSDREMKFVRNYTKENIIEKEGSIDLTKYLSDPRYGNIVRYEIPNGDTNVTVMISYNLNIEDDKIEFFLSQKVNDKFIFISESYFTGIHRFDINDSHLVSASYLYIPKETDRPSSIEEISASVPLFNFSPKKVLDLIDDIIRIFISIQDRPERTKMVKCVNKKYYEKKEKNIPVEEEDYIIWRILKTKTEANAYVKQMKGTRADAEYVMEEWERRGYFRTLKSGKQVWVSATVCKRHLPLTEKEIRIKL